MAYESEYTKFMRGFLAQNPQLRELQKQNRATWWDKPQDLETSEEHAESAVAQPGYVYFSHPEGEDKPA
jgi:Protein of unknown function (DUF3460)